MDLRELWAEVEGPNGNRPIWDDQCLAAFLGIKTSTLKKIRSEGEVPIPFRRIGKRAMYKPKDCAAAIEALVVEGEVTHG